MTRAPWFLLGAAGMAAGTWFGGWWAVPLVGAALGVVRRRDPAVALLAGLAAVVAWGALLAAVTDRAIGPVLPTVGPVLRLDPARLVAVTLGFAAILAMSAAGLARAVTDRAGDR
jgi:hypothetical protein